MKNTVTENWGVEEMYRYKQERKVGRKKTGRAKVRLRKHKSRHHRTAKR